MALVEDIEPSSCSYPCQKEYSKLYKLYAVPIYDKRCFYKLSWAWAEYECHS